MQTHHQAPKAPATPRSRVSPGVVLALPVLEAARALGIGRTKLYALRDQGHITFAYIGRKAMVTMDELERVKAAAMRGELRGRVA